MPRRPSLKAALKAVGPVGVGSPATKPKGRSLPKVHAVNTRLVTADAAPVSQTAAPSLPMPRGAGNALPSGSLLQKKKRERLLLVSFRMPEALKEKLEAAAKLHEVNQTDLINEGVALNLQRYL